MAYVKATREPAPPTFGSNVSSLADRGILVRVGGRAGRTLYAHRDAGIEPADDPADPAVVVLEALERAVAKAGGHPVPTVNVMQEIHLGASEGGPRLNSTTVRGLLMALSRVRKRGATTTRSPRVLHLGVPGDPRWLPIGRAGKGAARRVDGDAIGTVSEGGRIYPTRAAAARGLAEIVRARLGRTPSQRELAWYLDGPAVGTPEAEMLGGVGIGRVLRTCQTLFLDSRATVARHSGGIPPLDRGAYLPEELLAADGRAISGERRPEVPRFRVPRMRATTCDGPRKSFAADRYSSGLPSATDIAVHAFDAVLDQLRVHEEVAGIAWLRAQSTRRACPPLAALASTREAATRSAVLEALAGRDLDDLIGVSERALAELDRWSDIGRISTHARWVRRQETERHRRNLQACRLLLSGSTSRVGQASAEDPQVDRHYFEPARALTVQCVGDTARVSLEQLEMHATSATELLGLEPRFGPRLYKEARRVRSVPWFAWDRASETAGGWIDRVDALELITVAVAVPRANVLVASATRHLGRVVRDARFLTEILGALGGGRSAPARRAIAVALGLLGTVPALEAVAPDPTVAADVAAWVLAAMLAESESAGDAYDAARSQVPSGPVRDLLRTAGIRAQAGSFLNVIG